MKNLYQHLVKMTLMVFICATQSVMAQVSSKDIFLNGNFSFENNNKITSVNRRMTNNYETTRNQLHLNSALGLGYTFFNRLILGGAFNYNFRQDENFLDVNTTNTRNYHTFSWGPFGRLYLINKKAGLFTEIKYLKGTPGDVGGYNKEEIQKGTLSILRYGIGGNYFLAKRLSLELTASYQREKSVGELKPNFDPNATTRVAIDSKSLLLNFGISYFIKTR